MHSDYCELHSLAPRHSKNQAKFVETCLGFEVMEDYEYLFKVILVGGTGVGKTSLVQRYTQGTFHQNTLATVGVDFRVKTVNVDKDKVKLQIWDPSGQERFRSIVHLYYRNAQAVVFVYDLTHQRTFDRLPDWMDEIERNCSGRILKILVGSKADKIHDREVPVMIARDFAAANHFHYFVETSALDNTNVDVLFQQIARRLRDNLKTPSFRMCSRTASYRHAKLGGFTQAPPVLHNPFNDDPMLKRTLRRILPEQDCKNVEKDLSRFGERIVKEIDRLGRICELNQPKLEQFDAWGRRFAKIYLFSPSAGLTTCPMAMTDGAVKTLKALGLEGMHNMATESISRLCSTEGKEAWTSGQWMTEKKGGSDVGGGCDTYAEHVDGDTFRLYGYKWFSSAIDADIALTLARIVDKDGNAKDGSRGLSLFLVKIRNSDGQLNGIQMMRLKNKFGTKQLPTAELLLDGTLAHCLGEPGRGVANISNMLNITRIHNAVASVSGMRRIMSLARDYSTRRVVFGQTQEKWPLHTATLAKMEVETRGCFVLLMEAAHLLGLSVLANDPAFTAINITDLAIVL
ncbi:Ras family protein [Teladorsagia circumcincta]|uniref:Ras family protein n=1 Tax=Teladorsagia circumcincta TaxID=45464 RepID=A0A2G9US25_TELCI|nr:Ras family protein [Teladorsagia circumcincta]